VLAGEVEVLVKDEVEEEEAEDVEVGAEDVVDRTTRIAMNHPGNQQHRRTRTREK
jgi:hypothetical protein